MAAPHSPRLIVIAWLILCLASALPVLAGGNLLVNGDFSAGFSPSPLVDGVVANGWSPFVGPSGRLPTFSAGDLGGNPAQAISGSGDFMAGIYQQVGGLSIGESYQAGVDIYPLPNGVTVQALVGVDPTGGTDPSGTLVAWSNAGTSDSWLHLKVSFTAHADCATVFIKLAQAADAPFATWYVDNAYLRSPRPSPLHLPVFLKTYPLPTATPTVTQTSTPTPTVTRTSTPTATATPTASPTPPDLLWDPRLTPLNVTVEDNPGARYQLIAAFCTIDGSWEDVPDWAKVYGTADFPERGGDHNAFGRVLDADGNVVMDVSLVLAWPDGQDSRLPEASGWANIPIYGGAYYPDQGQCGPYTWGPLYGNKLQGLGMPYNLHYSFFGVWKEISPSMGRPEGSRERLGPGLLPSQGMARPQY